MRGLGGNQEVTGLDRPKTTGGTAVGSRPASVRCSRMSRTPRRVRTPQPCRRAERHRHGDAGADRRRGEHRSADTSIDRLQVVSETPVTHSAAVFEAVKPVECGNKASDRCRIDDVAVIAAIEHAGHEGPDAVDDAEDVDVERPSPFLVRGLPRPAAWKTPALLHSRCTAPKRSKTATASASTASASATSA